MDPEIQTDRVDHDGEKLVEVRTLKYKQMDLTSSDLADGVRMAQ